MSIGAASPGEDYKPSGELDDDLDDDIESSGDDTLAGEDGELPVATEIPLPQSRGRQRLERSATTIPVHSGKALTSVEATEVLLARKAELVVFVGDVDVGKTTLIAALYESLVAGKIDGFAFAGSLSLIGFESRSFLSTAASGSEMEDTPRTSRDTDHILLHLAARDAGGKNNDLLLADVSGEHAKNLLLFDESGDYAPLFRSASRVLLLVDGEKLVEKKFRNLALTNAGTLMRAIVESPELRSGAALEVVVTKWDLCNSVDGLDDELAALTSLGKGLGVSVPVRVTAARPKGVGLPALFESFLETRSNSASPSSAVVKSERIAHSYRPHKGILASYISRAVK